MAKQRAFNVLGSIALVNFPDKTLLKEKKEFAKKILKDHKNIKTVLEKSGIFKGRLRKMKTRYLAGEKNKEVLYKENNCVFRFNIDTTYFSPRLSNERKEIASKVKKNDEVLVMFAGVSPYPIVIAKNSKAKKIYSNEINREANKYGKLNVELNKLKDKVELVPGDIKRLVKQNKINKKFDTIIMSRPQLKDTFLEEAFSLSKKGTRIYYYDFCKIEDIDKIKEKVLKKAKKFGKKIKILQVKQAGDIAPYKARVRVDFKILESI